MTIKRYLFTLIGGLVIVIAAVQLLLISYFQQHLNQEVITKSQQLSTQIIDFAVEHVTLEGNESQNEAHDKLDTHNFGSHPLASETTTQNNCVISKTVKERVGSQENIEKSYTSVQVDCDELVDVQHFEILTDDDENKLQMRVITPEQLQKEKLKWTQQLHKIIEDTHKNKTPQQSFSFIAKAPPQNGQLKTQLTLDSSFSQSDTIDTLVNYMMYLIIGSSIVALLLALWLSHHFTKPLRTLSSGFSALQSGNLGVQIEEAGINDYRKTMASFNLMSQKLAQLAENEKTLQQQSHLAELGEVSRGLAHALRNPMHTIGLSVEQLKDDKLPLEQRLKLQEKIESKIKHIDKTIKALLTLTSGEIQRNDSVPIKSVIQDVILEMKSSGPHIKLTLNGPPETLSIRAAESEVRAIIHTLVVNAVEANTQGKEISIELVDKGKTIEVIVKDQGKGIDSNIADKLFEPHVSTKSEGAGMGLYISRRLAKLYYGGDIVLENNTSGGCCATVTLQKENS